MIVEGVTPVRGLQDNHHVMLKDIGIKYYRLINALNDVTYDGVSWDFTGILKGYLDICESEDVIPHIIIGQKPQWIEIPEDWNDFDWAKWSEYVEAVCHHVCIERGFTEIVFEVGNEMMHNGSSNWMMPDDTPTWDESLQDAYGKLYWITSQSIMAFETLNPTLDIKLGGWASGLGERLSKFVQNTINTKRDFVGLHFYTEETKLIDIKNSILSARAIDPDVEVWATETGFDTASQPADPRTEYLSYSLLLNRAEVLGINKIFALHALSWEPDQQAIWKSNGNPTPQGLAMLEAAL